MNSKKSTSVAKKVESRKPKIAFVLGATCSGCDYSTFDVNGILDILLSVEPVFWPTATDFKLSDVESIETGQIDLTLWEGAVNNDETLEMAKLIREKSKMVLAFGSCSCYGGIPAMGNLCTGNDLLDMAYKDAISNEHKGESHLPKASQKLDSMELTVPNLMNPVLALNQVIDVDCYLPGCPPSLKLIDQFLKDLLKGQLPPKGKIIGPNKSVCEECGLKREHKMITEIKRYHQIIPDPTRCLLDQGIVCMGPATRGGCDAPCPSVGIPCRGCNGPTTKVKDQGAKMLSALASIIGVEGEEMKSDQELDQLLEAIKDPLGMFYRWTLPTSYLKKVVTRGDQK